MREDMVRCIFISLVYIIFPVFYTMKNPTKIASALKSVRSFSATTETSGFAPPKPD